MKQFIYFENCEDGMDTHQVVGVWQLARVLKGWMEPSCRKIDVEMLAWANTAEVGEYFDHRLGVLVRIKDI